MKLNTRSCRFFSIILATTFVLLISTTAVRTQSKIKKSTDEQALVHLVKQMADAQAKFDSESLEKIYASDYIEISPIGEVDTREKAIGFYKLEAKADRSAASPTVSTDEFQVRQYGNIAIVIARFTFTAAENVTPSRPPIGFRLTLVCRKKKGAWKIASVQATGIRLPRSATGKI
jgi:uncharacterized protein (TIGR02246 family)